MRICYTTPDVKRMLDYSRGNLNTKMITRSEETDETGVPTLRITSSVHTLSTALSSQCFIPPPLLYRFQNNDMQKTV